MTERLIMVKIASRLLILFFCSLLSFSLLADPAWQNVARTVAVGDVHGDYENFFQVLRQAGIVNRRGNWIADDTHLVQMGDLPDRGPDTDKAIDLLKKLERQAERRGGRVHVLIGNHEAMNMLGDLRYVHPGEYQAFVNRNSARLRERYYEAVVASRQAADAEFEADAEFRALWEEQVPLGYVEHRLTWSPEGDYGSWVLGHNAVIKIDRVLFVHGGVGPEVLNLTLDDINAGVREELLQGEAGQFADPGLATSEQGPLWYRGLASTEESLEAAHVDAALARYDVDHIVVGHTPGLGTIVPRFDGKVLVIDSGISGYYGGHLASLTIEDGQLFNTQQGQRLAIPVADADPIPYFEAVAELEAGMEVLQRYLQSLRQPAVELPEISPSVP